MIEEQAVIMKDDKKLLNILKSGKIEDFIAALNLQDGELTKDSRYQIKFFESDFFAHTKDYSNEDKLKIYKIISNLKTLYPRLFSKTFISKVSSKRMISLKKEVDLDSKIEKTRPIFASELFGVMSLNQDNPIKKKLHKSILNDRPELVANACEEDISIKTNYITNEEPKIKSLFNSPLEKSMHLAIQACCGNLDTYPNKVLHEIFPYDFMKSKLSPSKFEFFKQSTMDFVVYENDMPKYFFEIDSSFHDSDDSKRRDNWKDEICKLGGINLIRIRPEHPNQTSVDDFKRIVTTCMNQHLN